MFMFASLKLPRETSDQGVHCYLHVRMQPILCECILVYGRGSGISVTVHGHRRTSLPHADLRPGSTCSSASANAHGRLLPPKSALRVITYPRGI